MAASWWSPGEGLRSRPGYEDADAPSRKESQPGLPPIPGKVWGGGLESSARRARPVTVQDPEPGQRLCPHLVDAPKRLTAALMGLARQRFMAPNLRGSEALGVAVLGQRGHSLQKGPRVWISPHCFSPTGHKWPAAKKYIRK